MTWPSSDVVTTNVDATGDSPALARSDFLDLFTKFNLLRNHVSAFMQTALTWASAAAARAGLGAAASGANGDITGLSALTSLPTALTPLGNGQTYQNVGAGRAVGSTYQNLTGRTILVHVSFQSSTSGASTLLANVGANSLPTYTSPNNTSGTKEIMFFVPATAFYRLDLFSGAAPSIGGWSELRV